LAAPTADKTGRGWSLFGKQGPPRAESCRCQQLPSPEVLGKLANSIWGLSRDCHHMRILQTIIPTSPGPARGVGGRTWNIAENDSKARPVDENEGAASRTNQLPGQLLILFSAPCCFLPQSPCHRCTTSWQRDGMACRRLLPFSSGFRRQMRFLDIGWQGGKVAR
jgi:hypothetical protein